MTLDMSKYLGLFVSEASEHLARFASELVHLEAVARGGGDVAPIVHELFRRAHSVKGMSGAMAQDGIARVAHATEDLVDVFRRGAAAPEATSIDVLLGAVDALSAMVESAAAKGAPEADPALVARIRAEVERARENAPAAKPDRSGREAAPAGPPAPAMDAPPLAGAERSAPPPDVTPAPAAAPPRLADLPRARRVEISVVVAAGCPVPSVRGFLVVKKLARLGSIAQASPSLQDLKAGRIPDRRLFVALETAQPLAAVEAVLAQIADLERVSARDAAPAPEPPAAPAPPRDDAAGQEGGRTVRVKVELLDSFLDAVGELILATARLRELGRGVPEPFRPPLEDGVDRLAATVKDLHDRVMAVRMTPLSVLTERLPRAARDLARRVGKQVLVEVRGADIEIDRAILDELADPVQHLLRNAVDHGVEAPHLRLLAGKPATGRITVSARRDRDRVLLELADDGKGMDPGKLRAAAVARGALGEDAARALDDRAALLLACLPGVSTAEEVTELSGRGVGLDAVKRAAEALGGALEVESAAGRGTRWLLRLPLTVAVQPVLLVRTGGEVLGLPISKVHGALQVDLAALAKSQGEPVLPYDGGLLPVRDLGRLVGLDARPLDAVRAVVVAEAEGQRVGLAVDALLGQQEAVLKPLARPLDRVAGLSAVTVLPSGRPVFILDVPRLLAA
jgi:two-component system chemotaxis sensor kinase CheA